MNFLNNLLQQLRSLWNRSSRTYRAGLVGSIAVGLATVIGVGYWSSRPQYMPLVDSMSASETAEVVSKLAAANIPYQLNFSASAVSVPSGQWNEAKLAIKDIVSESSAVAASSDISFMQSPLEMRQRQLREKERLLAASILRYPAVRHADVHLAIPEPTPFERQQKAPTASVVLDLKPGSVFTLEHASSIAAMVSASVEGMSVESVTVTDTTGRSYSSQALAADGGLSRQFDYRRRLEASLAAKAEDMLTLMLGPGRAVVRVTADLDFTETERVETLLDKSSQVKTKEDIETTESSGGVVRAQGAAGVVANNLAGGGASTGSSPTTEKKEKKNTEFDVGKTVDRIQMHGGKVERLTVAALVDLPKADPNATPPIEAVDPQTVEKLIKQAVGFVEDRDGITVMPSTMTGLGTDITTMVETLDRWEFYNNLVRNASLGLAAVVALVLGLLLIRKLQPLGLTQRMAEKPVADRSTAIAELTAQVQQNPEVVSKIVAAWLNSSMQAQGASPKTSDAGVPERVAA